MPNFVKLLLVGLALMSMSSLALAETPPPTVEHDFSDADSVEGHIPSNDAAFVRVIHRGRRSSLIRPRQTFVPELLKSVETQ